ncbi:MAG: hypothetical protein R3C08_09225 [Hyphomonas sp.]
MDSNASTPAALLSVPALVAAAWQNAVRAAIPALPWMALLALAGGFYRWTLATGTGGTMLILGALTCVFIAGVLASLATYRAMIPGARGSFMALAHANLAIYLAFFFVSFFVFFFVGAFGVLMLQQSGLVDLAAEGADRQVQSALGAMMATPYGMALAAVYAAGLTGLCLLALRLLLCGAATVQTGRVMVFRTWGWTKGRALGLGLASLFTHVIPFLIGTFANLVLIHALGNGEPAIFFTGITGFALQVPFLLAGHGLAVAALPAQPVSADVA